MSKTMFFRAGLYAGLAFASVAHAQPASDGAAIGEGPIYLKCATPTDPDGVNDLYIDPKARTITDAFGTEVKYRVEGQFLVAETFVDVNGKRVLASTRKINRFTLESTFISPTLKLYKSASCEKALKKI